MKKMLIAFVIFLVTANAFGELPRKKTIGADTLTVIRDACSGDDQLIHHYYMEYKGSRDEEETGEEIYDDGRFRETFKTITYMKLAFLGVIDTLLVGDDEDYLEYASDFLLNPNSVVIDDYLSIAAVIDSLEEEPEGDATYGTVDVLSLAYTLHNLAFIVDMLWWYEDGAYQTALADTLDLLAGWAYLY